MSLKTRLRLAVAVLMSAMVVILSGLFMRRFLDGAFTHADQVAESIAHQVQAAVRDEVDEKAAAAKPPPVTPEATAEFALKTVETDPAITLILDRSIRHWTLLSEIFITDATGRVRASSLPGRAGRQSGNSALNLAEWDRRSLFDNFRQVYVAHQNPELQLPIAVEGKRDPILNIHVVVSWVLLKHALDAGVKSVGETCIACLVASLVLALMLPNFILSPLERLSHSIDLMTTGHFEGGTQARGESKEFAAVYSKLNLLGQQFVGAQENADQLRGNVEQLLERLDQAVLLFDAGGRLTMAGHAVEPLLGLHASDLIGSTAGEIFPPSTDAGNLVAQAVAQTLSVRERLVSIKAGERDSSLLLTIQPLGRPHGPRMGTLMILRDPETRGQLAAQLDIASRLTALSRLTRGVAHEIKNPLNAIRLHLEVLRSRLDEEPPEVDVISREISRLDRVVKTFLDFNRPVQPNIRVMELNDLVRDMASLIAPEARSRKVQVELRAGHSMYINGDPDLLKQAFLNVIMNGIEAMKTGGEMVLEVVRAGHQIEFSVSDTGAGIPPEVQDKIFNLYFTTKERGSGIGLAMTFRLIQLHDGKIEFSSQDGHGTTFRFSFPEVASPAPADTELSRSHQA